ncbi:DUF6676 family protein [Nocardia sp. XZ_19_385]|uniref:Rv1476 family membrane protein n=1 Tax=Nocardia sp. XZ_19_385 TaxID=2769488 RepID=UPI00188E056D|nr:DUF6676 family protein [Nocardia sp. XZ_19_385]
MTVTHTSVFRPMAAELPPPVTDKTIRSVIVPDLADDHVANLTNKPMPQLATIAADARSQGIELSIVVVPGNPGHDSSLRDLATEVGKSSQGTVVVFSDDWVGTYSDSISRVRLEWAEDAAKYKGGGHTTEAAQIFVDRLETGDGLSWTGITSVLLAGTVLSIGGLYLLKARRRNAASEGEVPVSGSARP